MAFQDDDSKTLDGSVLVHDLDGVPDSINSIEATQSVPDKSDKSKLSPTPIITPKSKMKKNMGHHDRNRSLGTMVPARYLTHAPSLIKLLDAQRQQSAHNLEIPSNAIPLQISKSAPDPNHDGQSPSSVLDSENDFNLLANKKLDEKNHTTDSNNNILSNGAHLYDSQGDIIEVPFITDGGTGGDSLPLQEPVLNAMSSAKQEEYAQLVAINSNAQNKDEVVDMQLLAAKAAEEFTVLANDNDRLQRDNDKMKEKYDDMMHERELLMKQLNDLNENQHTSSTIVDQLNALQSKSTKWELEKKLLIEQLREYKESKVQNGRKGSTESQTSDGLVGKTGLKLKDRQSEDAERLMMESLAKITKEKSELEHMMFKEKETKREYEMLISNLKKDLSEAQIERERLNASLDKQQQLYFSLRENAKKKEQEIDHIVGFARHESLQEEVEAEKERFELLEAVDEQKAYIEELEAENQRLMATKVKDDDRMFNELKAIRVHRFQPSMNFNMDSAPLFNAPSDGGTHSRAASQSFSNYSQSGLFFANVSTGELLNKTVRNQINLFTADEFGSELVEGSELIAGIDTADHIDPNVTPQPTERKVAFKKIQPEKVDPNKKKKMEEMRKINAEIEFFLLTCIAVKTNLAEEYPDKPDVFLEDAMKLFETAQKEQVAMSKFNLWIELRLREKYNLPKLEGFQKFMETYDVKGKMSKIGKQLNKAGQASKSLAKSVETRIRGLSKKQKGDDNNGGGASGSSTDENGEDDQATGAIQNDQDGDEEKENLGKIIRRKTEEIGTRLRGFSNAKKKDGKVFNDHDENATADEKESIAVEAKEDVADDAKNEGNGMKTINKTNQDTKGNDDDDEKENKLNDAEKVNDNSSNNTNQLCSNCTCIVM